MSDSFTEEELLAGRQILNGSATFRMGVAKLDQLPPMRNIEVALFIRFRATEEYE